MLGISLEMQEKTLKFMRTLADMNEKMSGVIIKIEGVGHGFCWGANLNDLEKSVEYFRDNDLDHKLSIVETTKNMSAKRLMQKIHRLNAKAELPGLFKYLELQRKAA